MQFVKIFLISVKPKFSDEKPSIKTTSDAISIYLKRDLSFICYGREVPLNIYANVSSGVKTFKVGVN